MISDDELKEVIIECLRTDDGRDLIYETLCTPRPMNACALCDRRCRFIHDAHACPMVQACERDDR